MALTLLRHAALPKENEHRYNGWTDLNIDPSLFDAQKVALLGKQKFDLIYSSDLVRCQQTLEMMGITEYITDERLREVRFKEEIEGLNFNEIEKLTSYKSSYIEQRESWHEYICDESQEAFEARIKEFLEALPENKEILICSHGGTLQQMMIMLGYAKNKIAYLEYIRIDNVI
ncbi:Phosphoglycerate mutase family [hydrothermal vent metagenome]|uniref:Phosphoglycerate mutase family n=1 Tax=hydrothermal vent metagenome TaxID=652676 RepID=A0A1W1C238_9ZZZZ